MKSQTMLWGGVLALLVLPTISSWSQTSIGEVSVTTRGLETLSETSTGPSAPAVIGRVREGLAGQPGVAPAPAGQPSAPQAPAGAPEAIPAGPPPGQAAEGTAPTELKPPESQPGEEGVPFSLTAASQFANEAVAHLRALRFNEAVEAYRQAKELEPRYEEAYKRAVELRDSVNAGKINEVKQEKVRPNMDLTWRQFLGWERGSQTQMLGYQFAPGLEPYPPGFWGEGQYPGYPPGFAAPGGPAGPAGFDAKGR